MCPACMGTAALVVAGATSTGGVLGLLERRFARVRGWLPRTRARDSLVPDVRIGLASGPTLSWEGDLYGPTVNLASRLVNFARPGTVLLADELGARLTDDPRFELRHLRPVRLQGIGRVRPWALRRARAS